MLHLDHTIVPAKDKEASARFIARMLGVEYKGTWGPFAPVHVDEHLSLDFDSRRPMSRQHYAFLASDAEFDAILKRVQDEGLRYGSGPQSFEDMQINHLHGGRGFYFRDPNDGHSWEIITHTYV
jgi:catechol 2,3-dioxygenase-like lactoylglutathione lyase family enzyme